MSTESNIIKFEIKSKIGEENKISSGIGILCNIPSKKIKALITYNHLMNLDFLNNGEKMILYINKNQIEINIKINRYKYTNEELDITIIEILDKDNLNNFIEIESKINSQNYTSKEILSYYLKNGKDLTLLSGKITNKNKDNYISNITQIKEGIILLKENKKLLGIIKNKNKIEIIPMNIIINEINFIKCIYEIKSRYVNYQIRIINSKVLYNNGRESIKLIINGEIISINSTYNFKKEGDYSIYISANNSLTNLAHMFANCDPLKQIDFSSFYTNQIIDMSNMFENCSSLVKFNLSSFNTNQVTNMSGMFHNCKSLEEIDLSLLNFNNITDMSNMFDGCSSLSKLNISTIKTDNVTDMKNMFNNCS